MPRLTHRVPKLCHHKGQDLAMVYVNGKSLPGKVWITRSDGSLPEVRRRMGHGSDSTDAGGASGPCADHGPHVLTIAEALFQFKAHAERTTRKSGDRQSREALRPMREKFGFLPLGDFGPVQLRDLRNKWIEQGLARNTIKRR